MTNQVDIPADGRKNAKCGSLEALCLFVSPARGQQPKKKSFSPIRLSDSRLSAQTPRKVHVDRIMDFTSKPFIIYSHLIHFLFICWQPRRPWGACFFTMPIRCVCVFLCYAFLFHFHCALIGTKGKAPRSRHQSVNRRTFTARRDRPRSNIFPAIIRPVCLSPPRPRDVF